MNKKGISLLGITWVLLFILVIGYAYWDYNLEKNGQNNDKSKFCKDLGYDVENEVSFFYQMNCYKIENGIKTSYIVKESSTKIGEDDKEHEYYLRKILW